MKTFQVKIYNAGDAGEEWFGEVRILYAEPNGYDIAFKTYPEKSERLAFVSAFIWCAAHPKRLLGE